LQNVISLIWLFSVFIWIHWTSHAHTIDAQVFSCCFNWIDVSNETTIQLNHTTVHVTWSVCNWIHFTTWMCSIEYMYSIEYIKEPYKRDYILQKRPVILRSLQLCVRVTSGVFTHNCVFTHNWHFTCVWRQVYSIECVWHQVYPIGTHNWHACDVFDWHTQLTCVWRIRLAHTIDCVWRIRLAHTIDMRVTYDVKCIQLNTRRTCHACQLCVPIECVNYSQLCVPIECVNCVCRMTSSVFNSTQLTHSIGTHNWL